MIAVAPATESVEFTSSARLYAIKELARRAGVTPEFFQTWRIEASDDKTIVYVDPGTRKHIAFRTAPSKTQLGIRAGVFNVRRASWQHPPATAVTSWIPDFIVPFCDGEPKASIPLFSVMAPDSVECPFDLPLATLLTLTRFEEQLSSDKDVHGRFLTSNGIASRNGFADRPIVDEYGVAMEQALQILLPGWTPRPRKLRVTLSHDIDSVGLPFNLRNALGHTVRRRKPSATLRDFASVCSAIEPVQLAAVRTIVGMASEQDVDSAIYWKASAAGPLDSGYDPRWNKVRNVISFMRESGVENGVHPGYRTFMDRERLLAEVSILREVIGDQPIGGRQHYLRWCPETWSHWERCGLTYDSSVGFPDQAGFRAGTCFPYHPWLLQENRQADLFELPLIAMDCALALSPRITADRIVEILADHLSRCQCVGGVLTVLWHNNSYLEHRYGDSYPRILSMLSGHETFDWRHSSAELY